MHLALIETAKGNRMCSNCKVFVAPNACQTVEPSTLSNLDQIAPIKVCHVGRAAGNQTKK